YLRGFFDGDGSIFTQKNKNITTTFSCQSVEFLSDVQKLTKLTGRINTNSKPPKLNFGLNESFLLRDILYKNNGFCLQRKKDRFDKMKRNYRLWTPEMTDDFKDLHHKGLTNKQLANYFNLTEQQIRDKKRYAI